MLRSAVGNVERLWEADNLSFLDLAAFFGPPLWLGVTGMAVGDPHSLDRIRTDLQAGRVRID
ncbi:hypothetical protein [Methylobacterium brachiatum]